MIPAIQKAGEIAAALTANVDWQGSVPGYRIVTRISDITYFGVTVHPGIVAFVPDSILASHSINSVALGIYKAYEEAYESTQALGNPFYPGIVKFPSGFSQEDLPSDLIGFWLYTKGKAIIGSLEEDDLLAKECKVMNLQESEHMYQEYEKSGEFEAGLYWRNWERRPRPASVSLPTSHPCDDETWPSVFRMDELPAARSLTFELGGTPNLANPLAEFLINQTTIPYASWVNLLGVNASMLDRWLTRHFETLYTIPSRPRTTC
jgi:hypothetical protein